MKVDSMLRNRWLNAKLRTKALGLAFMVFLLDQLTKALASTYLVFSENKMIFPGFDLVLSHNTGAAFSFLAGASGWQRWFFILVAIGMIVSIFIWLGRLANQDIYEGAGLALILGGALGNLYDRLVHGYVIDFILLYYKDLPPWPAFNIADSAICVGVVLFALDLFRKKEPK